MSDPMTIHDPVLVVVPAGEVDEDDAPPPARARIPHRLPVEGERRPDRPVAGKHQKWSFWREFQMRPVPHARPLGEDPGDEDVVDPQVMVLGGIIIKFVEQQLE